MKDGPAKGFPQVVGLIGRGCERSAARFFSKKRHSNTLRSRAAAPADLEPRKGLGLGLKSGVGLVWADMEDCTHTRRTGHL